MKILTKYILREHVGPFIFSIAAIVFVFLLNVVFRDLGRILGKGLPVRVIFEFFGLNLAWILALAIPMSVLIATLMAFGRLASDREIDAMKAGSIPIQKLLSPVFGVAVLLAVFMILFNNTILPEFNHRVKLLYHDISRTKPMLSLDPNVFYDDIPNYSILVQKIDQKKNQIKDVIINDTSDPKYDKTVVAERGSFEFKKQDERIIFTLFDGEVHEIDKQNIEQYRRMKFEKQSIYISVPDMFLEHSSFQQRGDREKNTRMLLDDIQQNKKALKERDEHVCNIVKLDLRTLLPKEYFIQFNDLNGGNLFSFQQNAALRIQKNLDKIEGEASLITSYRRSMNSLWVEVHKKYSIPFACLVFVLIGAPLGILVRQSGFAAAGWLSITFFLIYWAFLIGGEQLADRIILSPLVAMWSPNVFIGAIGIFLYLRTLKEATIFPWSRVSRKIRDRRIR